MQSPVLQTKSRTTTLCILCYKYTLMILFLLHLVNVKSVAAERTCHHCRGINCLRTTYEATQKCSNDFDVCVTVFDGQTMVAQGCLEQFTEELRNKCVGDIQAQHFGKLSECFKCNENLCNNLASSSFECVQCDSYSDEKCRTNPLSLPPSRCGISRTPNEYCFIKQDGKRVIRGCSVTLEEQKTCLSSADCMICQSSELGICNDIEITMNDNSTEGDNKSDAKNTGDGESGSGSNVTSGRTCHQCSGINCLRTTYDATQKCLNDLDICVTVFDGQTALAQGCLEQLSEELRHKCVGDTQPENSNELQECFKCNDNLCNNMASSSFECIQCDSDSDENCLTNAHSLMPSRCGISRTPNEYCFVKQEDKRVTRGCSNNLEEQLTCLLSDNCMICQPSALSGCNGVELTICDSNSDGGNTGDNGYESGSDGENTGDDGSGSGEGGESGDGGSGSGSGNGGADDSGDGGSSDGFDDSGTSVVKSHIYIFVINVIMIFFVSK